MYSNTKGSWYTRYLLVLDLPCPTCRYHRSLQLKPKRLPRTNIAARAFPLLRPAAVFPVIRPTPEFASLPPSLLAIGSTVTRPTPSEVRLVPGTSVLLQVAGSVQLPIVAPVPVPVMRLIDEF